MHARINAAHNAYRHAADLAPARRVERAEPEAIDVDWTWVSEGGGNHAVMSGRHFLAIGGSAIFLVAGAICGMWLNAG